MHYSIYQWISIGFAGVSALSMAGVVALMVLRKRNIEFPIFVSYLVFGALATVLGLLGYFYTSCLNYQYLYWVIGFLFVALEFGVMYEVFANAFKPYSALIDLGRMIFAWASAFLLIAAVLTAVATVGPQESKLTAAMHVLERSMRLIECGLLVLFFLFEKRLGLSWRIPSISIAIGLGCSAAMDLSVSYLKTIFVSRTWQFEIVNTITYLAVVALWSYCMAAQKVERKNVLDSKNRLIFQRWNEVLVGVGYSEPAFASTGVDSFLPSVERTVERVMARKLVN
ncbi:MAG TPA: hypothetical protein VHN74_16560 [Candidatus Angelobacter sp.]|nr:hypothetical protein [Candidatus Angelobacter sp.]